MDLLWRVGRIPSHVSSPEILRALTPDVKPLPIAVACPPHIYVYVGWSASARGLIMSLVKPVVVVDAAILERGGEKWLLS